MDIGFGSDRIGFQIAELSTALVEFYKRSMSEIQAKAKSGQLTPQQFAAEQASLYDQCAELSHLFGDKFRESGDAGWAALCDSWAQGFDQKSLTAKSAVEDENTALSYFKNTVAMLAIFDDDAVLSSKLGEGAGGALGKALGVLDKGFNAWDEWQAWLKGDTTDMTGIATAFVIGDLMTEVAAGIVMGLGGPVAVTAVTLCVVGAAIVVAGDTIRKGVNGFLEIFGGEDEADAAAKIKAALSSSNSVTLPHVGDKLFFGTSSDDTFVGSSGIANDMVGGLGVDIMYGADKNDFLSGGVDNDTLRGDAGNDTLRGGDGDDTLDGGTGNDRLEGGLGFDTYKFITSDLTDVATDDVIVDKDGQGRILFNNLDISGTGIGFDTIKHASLGDWETSDGKFRLSWREAEQTLVIMYRENGSRILVQNWKNGDLGITIPGFNETHPNDSAPLTNDDDVFGHNGNNSGDDHLNGLAGNDGISAGTGKDIVDGGLGDDLIFGGSGNDELSGGDGNDFLIDGSELVDLEDWSDQIEADGKSQRQRIEEEIASLGSAVVSKGKGWYIRADADGIVVVTSHAATYPDPNAFRSGDDYLDGGDGDDNITAGEGNDTILGGRGNDVISGGHDDDVINGGEDNDTIYGDLSDSAVAGVHFGALVSDQAKKNGNDIIDGGAGDDQIVGGGGNDILYGGLGDDRIGGRGSLLTGDANDPDRDYIDGGAGNDSISGDNGDDTIFGGDGDDHIRGDNEHADTRSGNDTIDGGAGNDFLAGDAGDDILRGGDGSDELNGDAFDIDPAKNGRDYLDGGAGNDKLFGGGDDDTLIGGDGDDILLGDADESQLAAKYHGNDFLSGGAGADQLLGGGGNDVLDGGIGNDQLFGGTGDDSLSGGADNDMLSGDVGNDALDGGDGDDEVYGGEGDDSLGGGAGTDKLWGGAGKDSLAGGDGDDILSGEVGDDTLDGGAGNDRLTGGAGNDVLIGGDGNDTYVFTPGSGSDLIRQAGAAPGQDTVLLEGFDASSINLRLQGDDLILESRNTGDVVLIQNYFAPSTSILIQYGNGSYLTKEMAAQTLGVPSAPVTVPGPGGFEGTEQGEWIYGTASADTIYGLGGDDFLSGGGGNDILFGGTGYNTFDGGRGNDTYHVSGSGRVTELQYADAGSDVIMIDNASMEDVNNFQVSGSDLTIFFRNLDMVTLEGFLASTNGTHIVKFADGRYWTAADFNLQPLTGTSGDDVLGGTPVNDVIHGEGGNDIISGGDGSDRLYGDAGDDTLYGGNGADVLFGGNGIDVLDGGAGNDELHADGDGLDVLKGASGDDYYYVRPGDEVIELENGGIDTVYASGYDYNGDAYTLPDNVENLIGLYENTLLESTSTGWVTVPRLLQGNALDNTISLVPEDGLHGHDGHVYILDGGEGADTLIGTAGDEIYVVDQEGDRIFETDSGPNQSIDTVRSSISYRLVEGSNLENIELIGSGNLSAWGDSGKNMLDGSQSYGIDHLYGDMGDDRYRVDESDVVVESSGGGNDTVVIVRANQHVDAGSTFNLSAYANVENMMLDQSLADISTGYGGNILGDSGNNELTGNAYRNIIHGGDGDDDIYGGNTDPTHHQTTVFTGPDYLYGDAGNDIVRSGRQGADLFGGTGDDELYGADNFADRFHYNIGDGVDTIYSNASSTIDEVLFGDGVSPGAVSFSREGSTLVVLVGPDPNDQLRVANYWSSSDANASLTGAIDRFVFTDGTVRWGDLSQLPYSNSPPTTMISRLDAEAMGGESFQYSLPAGVFRDEVGDTLTLRLGAGAASWMTFDPATGVLIGTPPIGGQQVTVEIIATDTRGQSTNAWLSVDVRNLIQGTASDDNLSGTAYNDDIHGGAGNDTLTSDGNADRLYGGIGDDTYQVNSELARVVEYGGEGFDIVVASVNYQLGENIERLVLSSGSTARTAIGNGADNELVGNALDNMLDGGAGADTLTGGLGNDIYVVDQSDDLIVERANEGSDTVRSYIDWTLGNSLENLELLGTDDINGTGNAVDNIIEGNDGNNRLEGGAGNDRLYGGAGDDYLILESSGDRAFENAGEGFDIVERRYETNLVLSDNVENLILGAGVQTGNGNELDNEITGNSSDNKLSGLGDDDTLYGLGGADSLWGGDGWDLLSGGDGNDYLDGGAGEDELEGGAGGDTLVGGSGDDYLMGGLGDDSYVVDASSGSDVIDNVEGGFDGVFFTNGVTRDRLSFTRDGNDLLILVDANPASSVRVLNHFAGGDAAIDFVQPDGGSMLTTAQINQIVSGGTGSQYDQTIQGTASAEQLVGSSGKDLINGLAGDDTLFGMAGNDTLQGGDGNDYLAGGNGSGTGSGNDRLEGGAGNDQLNGEDASNTLIGGVGDDKYVYGNGQDVIDNTGGGYDGIFFSNGITASQLTFSRDGDDLVIKVNNDATKTMRVTGHFLGGDLAIDYVQPASGSLLNTAAINALAGGTSGGGTTPGEPGNDADYTKTIAGTANGEQLVGTSGRDLIRGLAGSDTLFGMGGDDKLVGGDGDDYLSGGNGSFSGSGNDILVGGVGADTLVGEDGDDLLQGGTGDDQYVYRAGSGKDVIDNTGGGTDWLIFNGIDRTRLSFHRSGDDLIVLVDGSSSQQVKVQNHFKGGDQAISYVQPSDGYAIPASQFASLLKPLPSGFASTSTSSRAAMPMSTDTGSASPSELHQLIQAMSQMGAGGSAVALPETLSLDGYVPTLAAAHSWHHASSLMH